MIHTHITYIYNIYLNPNLSRAHTCRQRHTHSGSTFKMQLYIQQGLLIYVFIECFPHQPHRVTSGLFTGSNLTQVHGHTRIYTSILTYMYTSTNIKHKKSTNSFFDFAIKLGHAGIVDPSVKFINTSLQKHLKYHQQTSSGLLLLKKIHIYLMQK